MTSHHEQYYVMILFLVLQTRSFVNIPKMNGFNFLLLLLPVTIAIEELTESEEHTRQSSWGPDHMIDYGDLGVLYESQLTDPNRTAAPYPPQTQQEIDVRFYLLKNGRDKQDITSFLNPNPPNNFGINPKQPTIFIVHGFIQSANEPWLTEMGGKIWLVRPQDNIIIVDWGKGASGNLFYLPTRRYYQAISNAWVAGGQISLFCKQLNKELEIAFQDIHIIGHSLGAHVAGYAGARLSGALGRISALDAAQPEFEGTTPFIRIDPTDAKFVDAIHTDTTRYRWVPIITGLGIRQPVGHIDFYPNGGEYQPGCLTKKNVEISEGKNNDSRTLALGCKHKRAYEYYTHSTVPTCIFWAHKCDNYGDYLNAKCFFCGPDGSNCVKMGFYANTFKIPNNPSNLTYYLLTLNGPPFCVEHSRIKFMLKRKLQQSGKLSITLYGEDKKHEFEMNITDTNVKTITQVIGIPNDLGPVKKLQVVCKSGTFCTNFMLLIQKIILESLDIPNKSKRKAARSILCSSQPVNKKPKKRSKETQMKYKKHTFLASKKCRRT